MKKYYRDLLVDIVIIICTTILALYIVRTTDFHLSPNVFYVFLAGVFFTSAFTMAPAAIVLAQLSNVLPLHTVVIAGAAGAMLGDLVLFVFVRDRFSRDIKRVFSHTRLGIFARSFHFGFLKWCYPLLGAVIIISPFPDEFGITLMGISKVKTPFFLAITFFMNILGILALIGFSRLF